MCPAAITGTSRYTTVGATTLPRPLLRRFRAAEDVGPRETTTPTKKCAPVGRIFIIPVHVRCFSRRARARWATTGSES